VKISEILNLVNTFEKNNFLRVIDQIIVNKPVNVKKVDKILNQIDGSIKNADNLSVQTVFNLVSSEYIDCVNKEFENASTQFDIFIDILIRDGNSLMSREWMLKLYEKEIKQIKQKIKSFPGDPKEIDEARIRDYQIYKSCVEVAYTNDEINNRDKKVTPDEQSILNKLVDGLELSHEEVKLINYSVLPLNKLDVDEVIAYLVKSGIVFYSKKNHQIYVPDEIVQILRLVRGKQVPDKIFKRVLKRLKSSQINLIARKHSIPFKWSTEEKIIAILQEGISFRNVLLNTMHKEGLSKTERKKAVVNLIEKELKIDSKIGGASLEDKIDNLIYYFIKKENEDSISISLHGYDKLLLDLNSNIKTFDRKIRDEFELQENTQISAISLLQYNIKPLDILYSVEDQEIKEFCENVNVSTRGDEFQNILEAYRDVQNLYLENYINISNRDLATLSANNIDIKEAELGLQYELLTKIIFEKIKLNVDDDLKRKLNTSKDKIDLVVNLGNDEVIIIECKTKKDKKFNTYSSASRQIKAYKELAERNNLRVIKTFIVAPDFSDDFINECGLDYDLNLSLITSHALLQIYEAFQGSKLKEFPYKILLRDVLIDSDRVVRSITK
jgi:hypothetical protein